MFLHGITHETAANDTSADDIDKEELRNIFHSVKKFTLRYVLLVSITKAICGNF